MSYPPIRITLGDAYAFKLTEIFARDIHADLVRRQLNRTGHICPPGREPYALRVRAAIVSISQGDRKQFIASLQWAFDKICDERGTHRRWQNHVAQVAAVYGLPCPATPDDPAWATFILRIPAAA